jgi:hypothetical protein
MEHLIDMVLYHARAPTLDLIACSTRWGSMSVAMVSHHGAGTLGPPNIPEVLCVLTARWPNVL